MKPEKQKQLADKYPQIFCDLGGDPMQTCMAFGLEVGDGWYDLIDKLCADIMAAGPDDDFRAAQVKEKFGGLRFYTYGGNEEINRLIDKAESESYEVCEDCGSRENVTSEGSWITTLCKKCRNV